VSDDLWKAQLERGLHEPSLGVLRAIASALGVPLGSLLTRAGVLERDEGDGEPRLRETEDGRIDTRRAFVAGLSAGGAMAAILAAVYPDLFAAVAVHSGLSYRSAASLSTAYAAMARGGEDPIGKGRAAHGAVGHLARPVPSIVVHGSADHTVDPINAEQLLQQSMTANGLAALETCDLDIAPHDHVALQGPGGHAYTRCQWTDRRGVLMHELLTVDGLGHAWSGGTPGGSHTDPRGPDATEAIWRFFAHATADQAPG
jgi:poly(3-hydroxybutyrate) depolymerase